MHHFNRSTTESAGQAVGGRTLRSRRARLGALIVVPIVAIGFGVPRAVAFGTTLPCAERESSKAFSPWLDPASYFLASNGDFESGSTDWSMSPQASITNDNEPFHLSLATDSHALALAPGGSAESRTACVGLGEPTVRMFVKTPKTLGAWLRVDATVRDALTGVSLTTSHVVLAGITQPGWAPTPEIVVANLLSLVTSVDLTLRITTGGVPATWAVDDVYVDPFKST